MKTPCSDAGRCGARDHLAGRILEDESLTAELTDQAARVLLDWGVARAEALATHAEETPSFDVDAALVELRRAMRRLAKLAGTARPEAQVERLHELLAHIGAGLE
jgi:hypothetical protein